VPLKISAFPKCYLDTIAGTREMTVFQWIEMAKNLDADGLEMYDGFFTSLDNDYIDKVANAIHDAGFAMPMLCCSPDFTHPDANVRKQMIDTHIKKIEVTRRLGRVRFAGFLVASVSPRFRVRRGLLGLLIVLRLFFR